jgi:F-type H+-transporting ATPase subunit b
MRRLLIGFVLSTALLLAQDHGTPAAEHAQSAEHAEHSKHAEGDPLLQWKVANFLLLVLGLGFLISKMAPPFFAGRTAEIQKGLAAAAATQKESDAKVAAIEARLQNLEGEIAAIRSNAAAEMAAEESRVRKEGEEAIAKLRHHTEVEIDGASRQAQAELRQFAAKLALETAEGQLRARLNPQLDAGLLNGFLKGLNN